MEKKHRLVWRYSCYCTSPRPGTVRGAHLAVGPALVIRCESARGLFPVQPPKSLYYSRSLPRLVRPQVDRFDDGGLHASVGVGLGLA